MGRDSVEGDKSTKISANFICPNEFLPFGRRSDFYGCHDYLSIFKL